MQWNSIHIAFCVNDIYAQYIAVTIKSIAENFQNNKEGVCIHILTDYISTKNIQRLNEIVIDYERMSLYIHKVDDSPLRGLRTNNWTIYTWYRLLLPDILPVEIKRVLYLDADTLVTADLSELFEFDMTNKSIAAVVEDNTFNQKYYDRLGYDNSKQYICAGVLLMNLEYWREHYLTEKMIKWARTNEDKLKTMDQDAINYICQDTKILLPLRFGVVQWFFHIDKFYEPPYLLELEDCLRIPAIIHYGFCPPWVMDSPKHLMQKEWERYNKMLRHPVKSIYKANGWMLIKSILWDVLHLFKGRYPLTIKDACAKIASKKQEY